MRIHTITEKEVKKGEKDNLYDFSQELIDLSNKYRIAVVLGNVMFLKNEPIDGKLLDVAGYSYDEKSKLSYPFFVDRLSGDNIK